MTGNGANGANGGPVRRVDLAEAVAGRKRAQVVAGLRGLAARPGAGASASQPQGAALERCDLCQTTVPEDHRHLLNLYERQIACVCESCWGLRSGDPEFRPTGTRTLWLEGFRMPDDLWAAFQIPIGLAFFMHSTVTNCVVALYPSPAGATESELHFESWRELVELNPVLEDLEADGEGLIVNRMSDEPVYAIAPIDRCYMLVGLVKASWEGISGGRAVEDAIVGYFDELRTRAVPA